MEELTIDLEQWVEEKRAEGHSIREIENVLREVADGIHVEDEDEEGEGE